MEKCDWVVSFQSVPINVNNSRAEYSTVPQGKHQSGPCTSTVSIFLCNPLLKHSAAPNLEQRAVLCWWRCQHSNLVSRNDASVAQILILSVPHSQKELVRPLQVPVCVYHARGLSTSPSLNRCSFQWQCPVSRPIIILSWFLLTLSNPPALVTEDILRKPLAWLCPKMDCWYFSCVLLTLIIPQSAFADVPWQAYIPEVDVRSPAWLIDKIFHFYRSPCYPAAIPAESCLVLPISAGMDGSSRLI